MTVSVDGNPVLTLRAWADAYRKGPKSARFPSDPNAEFLPRDLDAAAAEIERLRAALEKIANDEKNCAEHCRWRAKRALEQQERGGIDGR